MTVCAGASSGGGSSIGRDGSEVGAMTGADGVTAGLTVDYVGMLSTFVSGTKGALLAALFLRPDGLHLRTNASGATYACRAEEVRYRSRLGSARAEVSHTSAATGGSAAIDGDAQQGSSKPVHDRWPLLFSALSGSTAETSVGTLWPAIYTALEERRALLRAYGAVHVPARPVAELGGGEHSFWLLYLDDRVLLVLAFVGKRPANDTAVSALLHALSSGLGQDKLIEGSFRDCSQDEAPTDGSWWSMLLRRTGLAPATPRAAPDLSHRHSSTN